VFVYGAGGHAQVVIDVLLDQGFRVVGMFNDHPENQHRASRDVAPGIRRTGRAAFGALDHAVVLCVGNNAERAELDRLLDTAYATCVHSSATIASTVRIGVGTVVLHRAIVQPNTTIGRHVLVNTGASIDHDNDIGDFAHISPNVTLCGHVTVGEGSHVGAGAVVIPKITIGRWCTVGAGSVVLRDVPDHTTVVGNPARVVPHRSGQRLPDVSC
jgi:acetyltransferase EpsM